MAKHLMDIEYDLSFEVNAFKQPRIISDLETVKNIILFILFAKPGQYPSMPDIGLDIESLLYSHYDELDTEELKDMIIAQCSAMKYYLTTGSVTITKKMYKKKPSLLIQINGNASYPKGYMNDARSNTDKHLIGITFNELNEMIFDAKDV